MKKTAYYFAVFCGFTAALYALIGASPLFYLFTFLGGLLVVQSAVNDFNTPPPPTGEAANKTGWEPAPKKENNTPQLPGGNQNARLSQCGGFLYTPTDPAKAGEEDWQTVTYLITTKTNEENGK